MKPLIKFLLAILQAFWKAVRKFLKKFPELISIPTAFALWVASIPVLRWFDPTSGIFDAGVFQVPIFAVLQLFIYVSIAYMTLRLVFGTAAQFLKNDLKNSFEKLTPWQKILFSYGLFLSLLFALVALSYTLR